MTFPTIPTVGNGRLISVYQNNTTATRTFPNQSSLTKNSGDLIIAIIVAYQTSTGTNAAFSGWGGSFTEVHDSATSSTLAIGVAYKFSTGSETGTFTVTQAGTVTGHASMILLSIPGAHASAAPEVGGRASGTTTTATPGSLTPSWGAADTLWIALGATGEDATTSTYTGLTTTPPTNYGNQFNEGSGVTADVAGAVDVALAFRQLNATSEDPGNFGNDTSNARWGAITIGVRPSPNATVTPTVVSASTSIPSVKVNTPAPAVVAAVTTIALLTGSYVPWFNATTTIPTPAVSNGTTSATATPGVVSGTTSIPTPTITTNNATATPTRVSATTTIGTPTVGTNPPYFTNLIGGTSDPVFIFSAEDWGVLFNAGTAAGTSYDAAYDDYFATKAAQGYNGVYVTMFSSTNMAGGLNGPDGDGTYPYNTNSTNPLNTPNTTFWARRDSFLTKAAANGFYVFLNVTTPMLDQGSFIASWSTAQWQAYGTFLGNRYASYTNIKWMFGDDYFGGIDSNLTACYNNIVAAGGTQAVGYQGYQETTSRKNIYDGSTGLWGNTRAQFNFIYSYNVSYDGVEKAAIENNTMTPIPWGWADGTFLNTGGTSGITGDQLIRRHLWWAISSGTKFINLGDNDVWQWDSGAQTTIETKTFYNTVVPAITSYVRALPGWHRLIPDTSSQLVTAGRGTHASPLVSGGSGGQYLSDTDSYVTASRTLNGSLAVIYMSHGSTITIDQSKMQAGYIATWVDPKNCATSSATPGSTYNSTAKGTNSDGQNDWVLVLQATSSAVATPSVVAATTTIPSVTVKTGSKATASVVNASTSIPTPTISTANNATATPSVVNATASIGAPTITAVTTVTVNTVQGSTSIPTPTITAVTRVTPTVVQATTSIPTPTITSRATVTAPVVNASTAIATPTVSGSSNVNVTPSVVAATTSIPGPGVTAGGNVDVGPLTVNATTSIPTPTVRTGQTATPAVVNATTTIATPTIRSFATVTPTVVAASTTIPTPTIRSNVAITPSVVAASTSIPVPVVTTAGNATATPSVVNAVTSIPTPAVTTAGNANVSATVVNATTSIPTPTVTSRATTTPSVVSGSTSIPTPSVSTFTHATVTPTVVSATSAVGAPVVAVGSTISPNTVLAYSTVSFRTVSAGLNPHPTPPSRILTVRRNPRTIYSSGSSPTTRRNP